MLLCAVFRKKNPDSIGSQPRLTMNTFNSGVLLGDRTKFRKIIPEKARRINTL